MSEWVPLYITFFLGAILFTLVPGIIEPFCDIEGFLNNPNFSPKDCPINNFALWTSSIVNFITNGLIVPLPALPDFNINFFSLFGLFPNNVVQQFLGQSLSAFVFLPDDIAFLSLALFFLGLMYSIVRLARG